MPVVDVMQNPDALSVTIVADFAAPVQRIWEVYADPRQLEQVWGSPRYPAIVVDHDLTPGGRVTYYLTSPEGDRYFGYWDVAEVLYREHFTFSDGFADAELRPDLPVSNNNYTFTKHGDGTRATYVTTYVAADALQQVLDIGVMKGSTAAINQIDTLLAA